MQQAIPHTREAVYLGWRLIGYRLTSGGKQRYFCFIAPLHDHVRLGFEYGVLMHDKHDVLEGSGKQVRYVTIHPNQELSIGLLVDLIQEAAVVAELHHRNTTHSRTRTSNKR